MAYTLNGWRRVGIVLTTLWMLGIGGAAFFEGMPERKVNSGVFVTQTLPPLGSVLIANELRLPDGKLILIDKDPVTGRALNPWEIDWARVPDLKPMRVVRWSSLRLFGLIIPICSWLFFEFLGLAIPWCLRGFRGHSHDS